MNHDEKEEHDMFIDDTPIKAEEEDILGRESFVLHLSNALVGWRQSENSESIVIALCGKWGFGKSSIINLVTKNIDAKHNDNKPTIVRFNPWEFSKKGSLVKHFFNEIAKKLEVNNDDDKDKKAAEKFRLYAKQLELISFPIISLNNWLQILSIVLGSGFIGSSYISSGSYGIILLIIGGAIFILPRVMKERFIAFANYLEAKIGLSSKSASELKEEITGYLSNRKEKIMFVIDDIDRLNQSEIKQIFQLIKINADFYNTIYLLSFDREVVENSLDDEQKGISGKDYMDKIVQVCFDIPVVNHSKIWDYFEKELKRVLNKLPKGTTEKYFSVNDHSWFLKTTLESEMKGFIKNIRDAKRFINSLEFNLLQMRLKGYMEVNVIDFIAIEAIRMFAPDFYSFMKQEKTFFTSIHKNLPENKARIEKVQKAIDEVQPEEIKDSVSHLIKELFPQIDSSHAANYEIKLSSGRRKELRVCESGFFDKYFTMLPSGGKDELSQFEIRNILHSADSTESLEKILTEYIKDGRIYNALISIGDFADDEEIVPLKNARNIVKVLFDISDNLPTSSINICCKFLKRENDEDKILEILKEIIPHSKGLHWPVMLIYIESEEEVENWEYLIMSKDKLEEMREKCVTHIQDFSADTDNFLKNKHLGFIMNRWYKWGAKKTLEKFIEKIQKNDEQLLEFIDKFISIGEQFREGLLKFFGDVDEMEKRLKNIKKEKPALYEKYKYAIDLYLNPLY